MDPTEAPPIPITASDSGTAVEKSPAAPPAPPARRAELRNSLWCVDAAGRVGMIAEINGGEALFFHADAAGKLGPSVKVPVEQLTQASRAQLPDIGLTEAQLTEAGYK